MKLFFLWCLFLSYFIHGNNEIEKGANHPENSTLPAISKVFVINLDRRKERMKAIDARLKKLHIPYYRFSAIDFQNGTSKKMIASAMKKLHVETRMNITRVMEQLKRNHSQSLNWGSTGCWQSHLQIYLQIKNGSFSSLPGPFLILEDDVVISSRIKTVLSRKYLYQSLPQDWEMFFLDHLNLKCHEPWKKPLGLGAPRKSKKASSNVTSEFCLVDFTFQTSAYVLRNHTVVNKLVDKGNKRSVQIADVYFNQLFKNHTIKAYALLDRAVHQNQNKFKSDVQYADGSVKPK